MQATLAGLATLGALGAWGSNPPRAMNSPEDMARLGAAWLKAGDGRIFCMGCGGLRERDEPPCTCQLERRRMLVTNHGVRSRTVLEVTVLEENEDVRRSPRGWGEASTHTVVVERRVSDWVEFTFQPGGPSSKRRFRVSRDALEAALDLEAS